MGECLAGLVSRRALSISPSNGSDGARLGNAVVDHIVGRDNMVVDAAARTFGPAGASAPRLDARRLYAHDSRLGPGEGEVLPNVFSRRGSDAQAAAERDDPRPLVRIPAPSPGARHASCRRAPLLDCDLLGVFNAATSSHWFPAIQFPFDAKRCFLRGCNQASR